MTATELDVPVQTTRVPPTLKVKLMVVTPKQADKWLNQNTHNRALRKHRVVAYAQAMQRGEWQGPGDSALIFDLSGRILNGQHRLAAVVLSDTPQVFMVLFGMSPKAQEVMDRGLTRNLGDSLTLRGETCVNNLAAALRWHHRLEFIKASGGTKPHYGQADYQPTVPVLLEILDAHPDIRDSVKLTMPVQLALHLRAATAAIHYRCSQLSVEDTDDFFDKLLTGASSASSDAMGQFHPIILFRNLLLQGDQRWGGRRVPDYREAALLIKTWNYYREGAEPRQLSWRFGGAHRELFPMPQ